MTSTTDQKPAFEGWAILELMGHRKLAGYLREEQIGGAAFLRIDIPGSPADESSNPPLPIATQFYSPSAVYCITPTTEDMARKVAAGCQPAPVQRWELPASRTPANDDLYTET